MAYPFAGFGSFLFRDDERPVWGSDLDWTRSSPSIDRSRPLGSATDSIVIIATGSATRRFELYLTAGRAAELEQLALQSALFTDWTRPEPDSRQAFLNSVVRLESVIGRCADGSTQVRWRCEVELISQ